MKNGPYTLIIAPKEYPGKKYRGRYCYEHHFIFWKYRKKIPKKGEVVHHKNEIRTDNRIKNLELISTDDHTRHHHTPKIMVELVCRTCLKKFLRQKRKVRKGHCYCGIKCQHIGLRGTSADRRNDC